MGIEPQNHRPPNCKLSVAMSRFGPALLSKIVECANSKTEYGRFVSAAQPASAAPSLRSAYLWNSDAVRGIPRIITVISVGAAPCRSQLTLECDARMAATLGPQHRGRLQRRRTGAARRKLRRAAHAMGLVNYITPDEMLHEQAAEYCRTLATRSHSGLAEMKRLARQGIELPLAQSMRLERDAVVRHLQRNDSAEGLQAFRDRRRPNFM